jgi:DNA-nicking Smr family endonuclease
MARRRIRCRALDEGGDGDGPSVPSVDLHGLSPEAALARLALALHRARVQGHTSLDVITGRGIGNARMEPLLRTRVEAWLAGAEGRRHGARSVSLRARGGCLRVALERGGRGGAGSGARPGRGAGS